MLHPAVQPGARLDYEYPRETVTVTFDSPNELELISQAKKTTATGKTSFTLPPDKERVVPVELRLTCKGGDPQLQVSFGTAEDSRARALPVRRFLLPWADSSAKSNEAEQLARKIPELEGGSWARGRALFFGNEANCAACHPVHGRGGTLGPDLSNLIHRDYASVLRDIISPSFAINPDHLTYNVELKSGQVLSGLFAPRERLCRSGTTKQRSRKPRAMRLRQCRRHRFRSCPRGFPSNLARRRCETS